MENVLVFASIVVGLGVADELVSFHRLLRSRHRVTWDWITLAVALLVLLTIVQAWWTIAQSQAGSMTIGQFLPILVELILLFLLAAAVLPDEVPKDGLDLKKYYDENGSYIWSLFSAALGWLLVSGGIVAVRGGMPLDRLLESRMADLGVLAVMISLIFIRRRWWHAVALLLLASGPVAWLSRSIG